MSFWVAVGKYWTSIAGDGEPMTSRRQKWDKQGERIIWIKIALQKYEFHIWMLLGAWAAEWQPWKDLNIT